MEAAPIKSSLLEEDPDCKDIVAKYIVYLPERVKEIDAAITSQNLQELKHLVHDLKGVSGGMGYSVVSELCLKLEVAISDNNVALIDDYLLELTRLKDRILGGFI